MRIGIRKPSPFFVVLASLLSSSSCRADGICDYYRRNLPQFYDLVCKSGRSGGRAGDAYSSFAASFNLNPASIPTEPSPYGLETIASVPRSGEPSQNYSFAMIKGFHKVGTAVSTASNMSFYGNDVLQRTYGETADADIEDPEPALGYVSNLNLGTAFELPFRIGKASPPSLGVSLRYNKITHTIGFGAGFSAGAGPLVFGFGFARERVSNYLPEMVFISGFVGAKLPLCEVEFTYLKNQDGPDLGPIQILSVTAPVWRFLFSAAVRKLNYSLLGDVIQTHYAAQFQVNRHLALGYLYNYLPGTNSLALQVFL